MSNDENENQDIPGVYEFDEAEGGGDDADSIPDLVDDSVDLEPVVELADDDSDDDSSHDSGAVSEASGLLVDSIEADSASEATPKGSETSPKAAASSQSPKVDRKKLKSEISELEKQLRNLEKLTVEQQRVIALDLLRAPEYEDVRSGLGEDLGASLELEGQRQALLQTIGTIESKIDRSSVLRQQRVAHKKKQQDVITELGDSAVEIGQAAWQAFQGLMNRSEQLAALFKDFEAMNPEAAAPEKPQKKGFFSMIKSTVGSVIPMGASDSQKRAELSRIAMNLIALPDLARELQSAELQEKLAAAGQYSSDLNVTIVGIDNSRREEASIREQLVELKDKFATAKERMSHAKTQLASLDKKLDKLVLPVAVRFLDDSNRQMKTEASVSALALIDQYAAETEDSQSRIEKLKAEIRIDEINTEREKATQKRHGMLKSIADLDRQLADLHEEHMRLHELVTQLSSGATSAIKLESVKQPLTSNFEAPLDPAAIANCQARARLRVTQANGQGLVIEIMGGEGMVFGRSHLDKKKGIRNDWVCRAYPRDDPESAQATRRVSKVHGGLRKSPDGQFFVADWSTAGISIDHAPLQKSAWIPTPPEFKLSIAANAIDLRCQSFAGDALVMQRPDSDARWYCLLSQHLGLAVKEGVVSVDKLTTESETDFAIVFKAGKFGVMPRPNRPDITINGTSIESVQLLQNGAIVECEGCRFEFEQLPADEPAI